MDGTLKTPSEIEAARIFDTTLRDGEQSPKTSFTHEEKHDIAALLDEMETHVIELGFPVNGEAEFKAVRDVASVTETTTCALARPIEADIEAALDTGTDMVHVFVSTSDVQIEDSLHSSRDDVVKNSVKYVERVADSGAKVMYSPMDATRTNSDYLTRVVEAVTDAGVDWINIPDTVGVGTPTRFARLVKLVREHTDAQIDVHVHDDFGLAAANSLAGLEAGADQVQVSVNGIGERAGNAAYEEVVMALESIYNVDTGIDTTRVSELSTLVQQYSSVEISSNKPVVGSSAFAHESGIHAAGVIENSDTFEPGVMTPGMVGSTRRFITGKHSGKHGVRHVLNAINVDYSEENLGKITKEVKSRGADGERVTEQELQEIVDDINV